MKKGFILFCIFCLLSISSRAFAEGDIESRIQTLEDALKKQEETIKAQQITINELKEKIKEAKTATAAKNIEKPIELKYFVSYRFIRRLREWLIPSKNFKRRSRN